MKNPIILEHYKGRTLGVFGLGVTGRAMLRACLRSHVRCLAWDDNKTKRAVCGDPEYQGVELVDFNQDKVWQEHQIDALVMSPGVPNDHLVYSLAQSNSVKVVSDIDLLYQHVGSARYIGVTGTNGKSTTASLIYHLLTHASMEVELGGNIGTPVMDLKTLEKGGWYVLEMSSFQLGLIQHIKFDIAILLNLFPDHLDYHQSFQSYRDTKMRIIQNQSEADEFIVGVDSISLVDCATSVVSAQNRTVVPISSQTVLPGGYGWMGGYLYSARQPPLRSLVHLDKQDALPGMHGRENIAAAVAVADGLGIPLAKIESGLATFRGLKHRLQKVRVLGNVSFYNDSKATNLEAAIRALETFPRCYWIAGGRRKQGDDWQRIVPYIRKVQHAFLFGEAAKHIKNEIGDVISTSVCTSLFAATMEASRYAMQSKSKQTVCFSPGCASFDQFENFSQRGDAFIAVVMSIEES